MALLQRLLDQESTLTQRAADCAGRASVGYIAAGVPSIAPAAYIWAGANTTGAGATAGRKLMQTTQAAATHAARVADAPLSAAALAPFLAPGEHLLLLVMGSPALLSSWSSCVGWAYGLAAADS